MILIPQIYLKNEKLVTPGEITSPIFDSDAFETAKRLKDAGASGLLFQDLSITPVGTSPNLPLIKKIHDELEMPFCVGGPFKTQKEIEGYVDAGADFVILGTIAYQKPDFLQTICKRLPGKIAARIDVRHGKVTIPGYAVATNKTALDYAQYFNKNGVRYILYSDTDNDGFITDEGIENLVHFCNDINARVVCTSEVRALGDIERIVMLNLPRLEGVVMNKSLYENKIDLKGAIAMVNDLIVSSESDITLTEM